MQNLTINKVNELSDYGVHKNANYLSQIDIENSKDETLVKVFVNEQSEDAFTELVNRYSDKVYRLAYRITGNPDDAEEVLQEVFIILVEKLNTFRQESRFSTWLYRVAANASYMFLRGGKKDKESQVSFDDYKPYNDHGALEGVADKDWSDIPEYKLLSIEGTQLIEKAINKLPEDYKIVFHMKDVEGLTSREIAKVLGLSLPAVKSRVLRARLFLRDKLSDYYSEWDKN
ncbi:MAG: sigma-70 family RNA polymerase sigma factor [Thermodesulfobacteriota bacterium]|nr:sigma-70 family RNA polymerase sigma factor [Candidatus Dadabacteria bacterium]MCZ6638827.1 sigma-70 family RNA polymerase sigma factor [Candidatus Dadabacteria bacterium]